MVTGDIFPPVFFVGQAVDGEFLLNAVAAVDKDEVIFTASVILGDRRQACADGVGAVIDERLVEVAVVGHRHDQGKRDCHDGPVHGRTIDALDRLVEHQQIDESQEQQHILEKGGPVAQVPCVAKAATVGHRVGDGEPQRDRGEHEHQQQGKQGCTAAVGAHDDGDSQQELQGCQADSDEQGDARPSVHPPGVQVICDLIGGAPGVYCLGESREDEHCTHHEPHEYRHHTTPFLVLDSVDKSLDGHFVVMLGLSPGYRLTVARCA